MQYTIIQKTAKKVNSIHYSASIDGHYKDIKEGQTGVTIKADATQSEGIEIWFSYDELRSLLEKQLPETFAKATSFDVIYDKVQAFYIDDKGNEVPEDEGGDLCDIGEVVASELGFY